MPIDNIAQLGASQLATGRPQAGGGAREPVATRSERARQDLPAGGQAVPPPDRGEVKEAVSRLNEFVQNLRRDLQFRVDEEIDRVIVTVVNSESGEVIRQIPSEEILAVARSLEQAQQGLLLNERA
ncbi:MAG: flagellar protein FlaG [Chromatiales bacterium]|nr:flagellar protein FlaG [Chromatiales bacterium]